MLLSCCFCCAWGEEESEWESEGDVRTRCTNSVHELGARQQVRECGTLLISVVAAGAEVAVRTRLALVALAHEARLVRTHLLRSESVCPLVRRAHSRWLRAGGLQGAARIEG